MADTFDPSKLEDFGSPASSQPAALDPNSLPNHDDSLQVLPAYANGSTVDAAINESPLTPDERLQMSLGNKAGKFDFLKQKFADVKTDQHGDFRVKDKTGTWYQVDPNTLEGVSAIDATARVLKGIGAVGLGTLDAAANTLENVFTGTKKSMNPLVNAAGRAKGDKVASETVGEIASALPMAGAAAASIGAGVATGGASLAVQLGAAAAAGVAVEAGRTSLGRLEGTYTATPEQQIKDVAYEGMLNMAGVAVPAGIKFGIGKFAEARAAKAMTTLLSEAPPEKLSLIRNTFGKMSGITDETFDRLSTKTNSIQKYIDEKAGASFQGFADVQNTAATGEIGQLGKIAKKAVSDIYEGNYNKALAAIPDNARINARDLTQPLMDMMAESGIAKRNLSGAYEMLSKSEYQTLQKGIGLADDHALIAFDDASYKHMQELFGKVSSLAETKGLRGADGARQVVNVGKILKNITLQAAEAGEVAQNSTLYRLASKMGATVQEAVPKAIETAHPEAAVAYRAANSAYSELSKSLEPLIRAGQDPARAASLLNTITSKAVSKAPTRVMLQNVAGQLEGLGQREAAATTTSLLNSIADRKAAIEFTKPMSQQISTIGMGGAATAFATGNPIPAAVIGATTVAANPRAAKLAFETGLKFNHLVRSIPKDKLANALYSTSILDIGAQSIIRAPQLHEDTKAMLLNQVGGGTP